MCNLYEKAEIKTYDVSTDVLAWKYQLNWRYISRAQSWVYNLLSPTVYQIHFMLRDYYHTCQFCLYLRFIKCYFMGFQSKESWKANMYSIQYLGYSLSYNRFNDCKMKKHCRVEVYKGWAVYAVTAVVGGKSDITVVWQDDDTSLPSRLFPKPMWFIEKNNIIWIIDQHSFCGSVRLGTRDPTNGDFNLSHKQGLSRGNSRISCSLR